MGAHNHSTSTRQQSDASRPSWAASEMGPTPNRDLEANAQPLDPGSRLRVAEATLRRGEGPDRTPASRRGCVREALIAPDLLRAANPVRRPRSLSEMR